ncbi:hypothetical protein [Longitalea arenae]|uniref:hypothetical protein n=1 Tax=Longitalea arenae TaxID=2812558 RepID=UPI0019680CEF|nr:hypothetical protein [Longitalea arenae]
MTGDVGRIFNESLKEWDLPPAENYMIEMMLFNVSERKHVNKNLSGPLRGKDFGVDLTGFV